MKRGAPDHPKMYMLAELLGVPRYAAVGIVETLWHFAQKYAAAGDVGRHPDEAVARGIGWDGDPAKLIGALIKARWLDGCPCHRLRIHDWHEHADQTTRRAIKGRFLPCYPPLEATPADASEKLASANEGAPAGEQKLAAVAVAVPCLAVPCPATTTAEPAAVADSPPTDAPAEEEPPESPPEDQGAYVPVEVLECPDCQRVSVVRQRPEWGNGWVCSARQGGACGKNHTFPVAEPSLLAQLPPRQIDAVRRSVERMAARGASPPAAVSGGATDLAQEAARRRIAQQLEQAAAEPAGKVWDQALTVLRATVERHSFATWFRPLICRGLLRDDEGARLVLEVPGRQFGDWMARNYWRQIEAAMRELGREELRVYLVAPAAGECWMLGPTLAEEIVKREAREAS